MQQLLSSPHYRRSFFLIAVLLIIASILIRYAVLPQFDPSLNAELPEIAASIIEKLLTSFCVTVLIGCLIFWLEPKVMTRSEMSVVPPVDISGLLTSAARSTEKWWFRGGTGRYLRAVTLPELLKTAQHSSSRRELNVQLIDPTNLSICREYASYRASLRSAKESASEWTQDQVRSEIYATILSLFRVARENSLLQIELTVLASFSSFRLDLSSGYVVITKEDRLAPAVRCDYGTFFYRAYHDDMRLTARQGRPIPVTIDHELTTIQSVRALFDRIGLSGADLPDSILDSALQGAKEPRNPYA